MGEIIREHIDNFKMIFQLAKIDFIKTYKGAVLGWLWAIIKPAFTIFVYWFTIEIGLRSGKDRSGYPGFLWIIASTVPWFYFSVMITSGASAIKSYSYLVTKMKFPVSIIPTIVNVSKLIIHLVLMLIVIILFQINGYNVDSYILQLPVYIILSFTFFEFWSMFSSIIATMSKDFLNVVKTINTFVFWMSGIFWDIDSISIRWVRNLLWLNPIAFLVNGYRNCFINKVYFFQEPKKLLLFFTAVVIVFILAHISYKKYRKELADVL